MYWLHILMPLGLAIPKMKYNSSTGAGTGVPFHFHGPGFGEVIFGRKVCF